MPEIETIEPESEVFNDTVREKAEQRARKYDENISLKKTRKGRALAQRKADSYWEAIDVAEGLTKRQAVEWIQDTQGSSDRTEMNDAVEVGGMVWSLQTACNALSSWHEILSTIAYLVDTAEKE